MISTSDLQVFLASKIQNGTIPVDLLKISQQHLSSAVSASTSKNTTKNVKFRIALDMEDCLDRFYGGYYSDWACGGQWNRAYQFVQLLANAFAAANIEVIAFFDGTLKENKKLQFERIDFRQKTISVLKHIRMIGTPPPKIWWLPPTGIKTALRNALRSINIQVVQTVNDHTMEVIEYYQNHKLEGILGLHPDYIISNTTRYFSSHDLRLSYRGALETKEFLVSKILTNLSLTPDHLPFVAVFLGGFNLIDEIMLKSIYQSLSLDYMLDFENRIKKIAEIVRNAPTADVKEFIKHLNLTEFEQPIEETIDYYQRKLKTPKKKYSNHKKVKITGKAVPLASETSENDEIGKQILNDVNNLVNEEEETTEIIKVEADVEKSSFVYTLPGEVLKTALNRHQRGIMDTRIYQLLTRKEILLPQVLEDEQYKEIPSVHQFYRPARQMIYAILFNLYHQKYLCSKNKKEKNKKFTPEIQIQEWIWSPQNDYKKSEIVTATTLPWAVPTVQRLWFGMAFEDKQRRMKAFLTIMRSDASLMLYRGFVPQHMLVLACVLRYIVTNPDKKILTRPELDAFLATAFSPQLINVEYTQELVLPGVHLRGVHLATLFMQGIETASLANDACGVPLPWLMTNPWLFFDGKLFHLKLKMSTYVQNLRELCDDHIEIVLKIERFRKAILEGVEHLLLPDPHADPLYRPGFFPPPVQNHYAKNISALTNIPSIANGSYYNNPQHPLQQQQQQQQNNYYTNLNSLRLNNIGNNNNNNNGRGTRNNQQQRGRGGPNQRGYQLKVGGVVVGSWVGGAPNRAINNQQARINRAGMVRYPIGKSGRTSMSNRNNRATGGQSGWSGARGNARAFVGAGAFGVTKAKSNRNRKNKKKSGGAGAQKNKVKKEEGEVDDDVKVEENGEENENKSESDSVKILIKKEVESSEELQNGSTVLTSDLANAICDKILKEDDDDDNDKIENSLNERSQPQTTTQTTITVTEIVTKVATPKKSQNKQINLINNESAADDGTNGKVDAKESESVEEEVGAGDVSV